MTTVASMGWVIALPHRPASASSASSDPVAGDGSDAVGFDLHRAWREHGSALLGTATAILGDRHGAEDCVQETFVRAWRARDQFRSRRGTERTWLFAIARNVAVDHLRARARRAVPVESEQVGRLLPPSAPPQGVVDDRLLLLDCLAGLSEEHREVLVATKLEGLTYAELAERVGVPVTTLRTRAFHALRAVRSHLEGDSRDRS